MFEALEIVNRDIPLFLPICAFIFGSIVGSFLNVCIYRIPNNKSIVSPGSTCACGQAIAWYDNIPILSWFILRGKARCCKQGYSFRYPAIEFLTGFLFWACWTTQTPIVALCGMLLVGMLICATFIDLDHMEIPDRFSIGLAIIGVLVSAIFPALHGYIGPDSLTNILNAMLDSVLGILVGSGIVLWIAMIAELVLRKEAMGFGDVKLLGGIGAFVGWQGALFGLFGGAAIGCVALIIILPFAKIFKKKEPEVEEIASENSETEEEDEENNEGHIPFGPMLAAGALIYFLLFQSEIDSYFYVLQTELFRR